MLSQFQSWDLYAESITSGDLLHNSTMGDNDKPKLHAVRCNSSTEYSRGECCQEPQLQTSLMGEFVDPSTRGLYYLVTNGRKPYAKNTIEESTGCPKVTPTP